jgi:catechol 2,3-dioxygenase-like lactoylglutathione lyase family enzyme
MTQFKRPNGAAVFEAQYAQQRRRAMTSLLTAGAAALGGSVVAPVGAQAPGPAPSPKPAPSAGPRAATPWTSEFLSGLDPVQRFRQAMRIQRSLEAEADILHWYHFIMVSVPVGRAPQLVVRWEGIELSRHRRIGENRYRLHGHNLSFPRDLQTGAFVDKVLNPVTGQMVDVPPMALTGDPGLIRSPEGVVSLDRPDAAPRAEYRVLRREGRFVKVDAARVPPATWPVTFLEMGYESTPIELFSDQARDWLPSEVSGAYVFPWPEWMRMPQGAGGHMFAAWSGYKLRSVEELPDEFRQRASIEFPKLLEVDVSAFDRPLTPAAAASSAGTAAAPTRNPNAVPAPVVTDPATVVPGSKAVARRVTTVVADIEKTRRFYEALGFKEDRRVEVTDAASLDVFGLSHDTKLTFIRMTNDNTLSTGRIDGGTLGFAQVRNKPLRALRKQTRGETQLGTHIMVMTTDGLDAVHERLRAIGAEILKPPFVAGAGLKSMIVRDPDGTRMEITQPPPP